MHKLRWSLRRTVYPRHLRGSSHRRIPHRHIHVLHSSRANGPSRVLVYVHCALVGRVLTDLRTPCNCGGGLDIDLMNGIAAIILGFVAFGVLHITSGSFAPWQWCVHTLAFIRFSLRSFAHYTCRLMIITGLITLITSIAFW